MKIKLMDDGNPSMYVIYEMFYDTDDNTMCFVIHDHMYICFKVTAFEYKNYFNTMEKDDFLDLSNLSDFEFENFDD